MGTSGNRQVTFKKFTVRDDRCGMKVGTDALLLGAWVDVVEANRICDVGTGSGIVMLMLAQRAEAAKIVGVEIEHGAHEQCIENVLSSPFPHRIDVHLESIQQFANRALHHGQFDLVVSNPPFFHDKPKSPHPERNLARHDDSLNLTDLFGSAQKLLTPSGRFNLVWPVERQSELEAVAAVFNFQCKRICQVHGRRDQPAVRILSEWAASEGDDENECQTSTLCIEEEERHLGRPILSPEYKKILDEFVVQWPD